MRHGCLKMYIEVKLSFEPLAILETNIKNEYKTRKCYKKQGLPNCTSKSLDVATKSKKLEQTNRNPTIQFHQRKIFISIHTNKKIRPGVEFRIFGCKNDGIVSRPSEKEARSC